jgi:hypothetical protein
LSYVRRHDREAGDLSIRHPEALARFRASHRASRLLPTCALINPISGKPEIGGRRPR